MELRQEEGGVGGGEEKVGHLVRLWSSPVLPWSPASRLSPTCPRSCAHWHASQFPGLQGPLTL